MTTNHATKPGRRYRYYVTSPSALDVGMPAMRIPAGDLEAIVLTQLRNLLNHFSDPFQVKLEPETGLHELRAIASRHIKRVDVHRDRIDIRLNDTVDEDRRTISVAASVIRRGKEMRVAVAPSERIHADRDPSLIKLVVKAWMAREALAAAGDRTIAELAAEQGYTKDYFGVLLRIAYLAPDIVAAILDGRQPVQLNRQRLARATNLPLDWHGQRAMFGFC